MSTKSPQRGPDPGRLNVRRAELGAVLMQFKGQLDNEVGAKTAILLIQYHKKKVEPQFRRLELLPWNWVGLKVLDAVVWCINKVGLLVNKILPKKPEPEAAQEDKAAPVSENEGGSSDEPEDDSVVLPPKIEVVRH